MVGQYGTQGRQDFSDPMVIAVIVVLTYIAIAIIWMVAHEWISMGYVYSRYAMSYPFYWVSSMFADVPVLNYPYNYIQQYCAPAPGIFGKCQVDFKQYTWDDLTKMSLPWNIFFGAVFVYYLSKAFLGTNKKHPQASFAKVHNLTSFMKEQKQLYPHLGIYTQMDLVKEPLNHPLYGMMLTSKQFAGVYSLVRENVDSDWDGPLADGSFVPLVNEGALRSVLMTQLGKAWQGWNQLSDTEWMVMASLVPLVAATDENMSDDDFHQAKRDSVAIREKTWALFNGGQQITDQQKQMGLEEDELASLWLLEVKLNREDYLPYIEKYRKNRMVQAVLGRHGFVRTIIYAMFQEARRLGVLEPADYRWLHYTDRSLWALINSIGRNRPFAEAAAVYDHYNNEALAGEAILYPQVERAKTAIVNEIHTFRYPSRNLMAGDYSMWLKWRRSVVERLYPGIDLEKFAANIKNKK